MKIAILARGNTLDSLLASTAVFPSWVLFVDPVTETFTADSAPVEAQGLIDLLTGSQIDVVLRQAEDGHPAAATTLKDGTLFVSFAGEITAREGLQRWRSGVFTHAEETGETVPSPAAPANTYPRRRETPGTFRRLLAAFRLPTPRGRHHLQQYGGRGH